MGAITGFLSIVPSILGAVGDYFKGKRELQQAKLQGQIALETAVTQSNIRRAEAGELAEIDWANSMAAASATSWKDEFWTIVLAIPAIMSFIPGLDSYVTRGFASLGQTPEWYQICLLVAVGASFGVNIAKKAKNKLTAPKL